MRTLSDQRSMAEARDILTKRLLALGHAHEALMRTDWKGASLREIITAELAPFADRVALRGPEIVIDGHIVQTFALLLHELGTNAAKHGALSHSEGKVSIDWSVHDTGKDARFRFKWQERAGPTVTAPQRRGFGSALLTRPLPLDPDVKPHLAFEPHGFIYEFEAPLSAVGYQAEELATAQ
jgi:two-component sensor histidine kinase